MRLALAQINPTVGDVDGNAAKVAEWIGRARDQGAELAIFPELCIPGYPAEDLYLKRHFLAGQPAGGRGAGRGGAGDHGPGRLRRAGGGPGRPAARLQLPRGPRRRPGPGRLPQEPPPQLLRLRRAALLRPGERADDDRGRRDQRRADGLRGRLDARAAGAGRGRSGRAADRQPLRLPLPPRQGTGAGGDVRRALARLRRLLRLLQPGRRPGRAGLRRPEPGHRSRRDGDRPRRPVRGGAAGLRGPACGARAAWPSPSPTSTRSTRR